MVTATALLGVNDLGRSVTPTFLFSKKVLFTIISTNQYGKLKKKLISVHRTWNPAILRTQGA